jgi:hypothetical protein
MFKGAWLTRLAEADVEAAISRVFESERESL